MLIEPKFGLLLRSAFYFALQNAVSFDIRGRFHSEQHTTYQPCGLFNHLVLFPFPKLLLDFVA